MSYLAKIANLSTYKTRQIARPYRVGCLFVYVRVFGDTLQDMNSNPLLFCICLSEVAEGTRLFLWKYSGSLALSLPLFYLLLSLMQEQNVK